MAAIQTPNKWNRIFTLKNRTDSNNFNKKYFYSEIIHFFFGKENKGFLFTSKSMHPNKQRCYVLSQYF